jgi:hypothetical protein
MRVIVLRTWLILTLAMPQVKTEQIQNLALFWDCCKKPKSVISGNLSKSVYVWATQWPTSTELKKKIDPSLDRSWPEFFKIIKNYGLKIHLRGVIWVPSIRPKFDDLKSFNLGGTTWDQNYTMGVDFLDHDLLQFKKIHIKIYLMRVQTLFWVH